MINKKAKRQTLFFKIFMSFLTIILLFAAFHMVTFRFFYNGIESEIIQYNRLILKNTAERYNTHFTRLKTLLFSLYNDEKVIAFNRQLALKQEPEVNLWRASEILKEVRSNAYNPMFYLENLIVYYDTPSFAVEKEGTIEASMLFSEFYVSGDYPIGYWRKQLSQGDNYKLHPARTFRVTTFNEVKKLELIPFSFRMPSSHYEVIALLDSRKLLEAFHGLDEQLPLMILQADGSLLYRSSELLSADKVPAISQGNGYSRAGDFYYFAEKDSSGLTYMTAVPLSSIASQASKLNLTMYAILALSVLIGVIASLLFSRTINRPVKQLLSLISQRNASSESDSDRLRATKIHEFDLIGNEINELMREKQTIHSELLDQKSLLTSFRYINKLKSINSDLNEWKDIQVNDEPFVIILYQLNFRPALQKSSELNPERAAYYIREYINVLISEKFPLSHTFQVENNQILSFVKVQEQPVALEDTLKQLQLILDRDRQLVLATIAVSSIYRSSGEFNEAYRQVLEMVQQAQLHEETQLITEHKPVPAHFVFPPAMEQELHANLQAGNEGASIQSMERMLQYMSRKAASGGQFRQFAEQTAARIMRLAEGFEPSAGLVAASAEMATTAISAAADDGETAMAADSAAAGDGVTATAGSADGWFREQRERLQACYSIEAFMDVFRQLFAYSAAAIRQKKTDSDPAIEFVLSYLDTKYAADNLSLDLLADKLKMSPAYLSGYIKEKTGANFSEHMNNVRIRNAKRLLSETDLTMQEIGVQIGYQNVTSFNRMFKKLTGLAPGEYRKQQLLEAERDKQRG
jgi:YesN/AraC family two-component response regulator